MSGLRFKVSARCGQTNARLGTLGLARATAETPIFMPVGTLGSVKGLVPSDLHTMGAKVCLANAYHLMLRPGDAQVAKLGGLHRFSGYDGAYLTDSGGFQVYSLPHLRKIHEDGVTFRSHINGDLHELSPERLVEVQENLGPDIAMVLDECPPAKAERAEVERALERTSRWARRALNARTRDDMAWFGIAQGALFEDLRGQHARDIGSLPFDGFAVGGVSVGEAPEEIQRIVALTTPQLPEDKPRYLMGVGKPVDLVWGVASGIDMFDCVLPSRNARNGTLYSFAGKIPIKNAVYRDDSGPLEEGCDCYTCQTYPRAFLRHLFLARESTFVRLGTLHNLRFYQRLMERMRTQIGEGTFDPQSLAQSLAATN